MPRYDTLAAAVAHLRRAMGAHHYLFITDLLPVHQAFVKLYGRLVVAKVRETALGYGMLPCVAPNGRQFDASFMTVRRSGPAYRHVLPFVRQMHGVDRLKPEQDVFIMAADSETLNMLLFNMGEGRSPTCTNPDAN